MTIKFSLTKQDYWHYNNFSILQVRETRKLFITTPVIIFVICMIAGFITKQWLVCSIMGIGLPLFYVAKIYLPMTKGINNMSADKLKEHILTIDTERKQVIDTCNGKEKKVNNKNILIYKMSKNRIYITLQNYGGGIIIPQSQDYNLAEVKAELDKVFL